MESAVRDFWLAVENVRSVFTIFIPLVFVSFADLTNDTLSSAPTDLLRI